MTTTNDAPAPARSGSIDYLLYQFEQAVIARENNKDLSKAYIFDKDHHRAKADVLASLASDASPRGEAVAHRWRERGRSDWKICNGLAPVKDVPEFEIQPLYAHPAPATVESGDAKTLAKALRWFLKYPEFVPSPEYFDEMLADIRAARPIAAALAPATEGRKG